jgi:nucleotide-binding universal stress UspA family protein
MKDVKHIVVGTDLSVTARNAFCYAKVLAKTLNATLTIVHVKENFMGSSGSGVPQPTEDHGQLIEDIESLMKEEVDDIHLMTPGQKIEINILTGDPVVVLTGLSESNTTDLIVIGTTGLSDVLTKLVGSTSHLISNQAHCPVILVPRDAKWKPIEKIVFASNYDSITSELVENITDFALSVKASIHFVNVKNFDPVFEPRQIDTDWTALSGIDPALYFEKHTIYGNDAIEQLQKYSEENGVDMIAFVSKHRGFWKSLLHKSMTENIALSTIIPIMVMHVDDGA